MSISIEHQLRYEVKVSRCHEGHIAASHTTGEHGLCSCGWELWSRNGRSEVYELHALHQDFEQRKQQAAKTHLGDLEAAKHEMQLNVTGDAATCSYCNWFYSTSGGIAKIMIAFENHRQEIRNAV